MAEKEIKNSEPSLTSPVSLSEKTDIKSSIKLSKIAKGIIKECASDPQIKSVYAAFSVVKKFCKQKYTEEQVGRYLRHIKAKQQKKLLSAKPNTYIHNIPYVPTYLPTYDVLTQQKQESICDSLKRVSEVFF